MKISELPQATEVTGEELLPVVQNGETKKVTRDDFVGTVPDGLTVENGKMFLTSKGEKVDEGAQLPTVTVDDELSAESENPAQNKAISNSLSNAVKGKVTGEILRIDDTSPVPHSLKIRAESKNLIDFNQIQNFGYAEPTIIENGFRLTGGYYAGIKNISVLPNTKYYLSYTTDNISGTTKNVAVFADNNTSAKITAFTNGTGGYFDSGDCNMVMIAFYASASNTSGTVEFTNIQLEYGTQSTEYKPYVDVSDVTVKQYDTQQTESEPIAEATVSENGTVEGLTSIYPNMVLAADSESVTLECEYNRDLNKVINNIIDAVISLGGNV